ncbi:hypothetical protein [Nocardia farcinica]|uniref:hypothetical protein n=1 Tax=Nocardia farcinica TaxID=37329 RepID=UPI00245730D3|nr:hypothetical protein [Nocardia farcinica]
MATALTAPINANASALPAGDSAPPPRRRGVGVPRDVLFLPELPRNPSGKVLVRVLRELD